MLHDFCDVMKRKKKPLVETKNLQLHSGPFLDAFQLVINKYCSTVPKFYAHTFSQVSFMSLFVTSIAEINRYSIVLCKSFGDSIL